MPRYVVKRPAYSVEKALSDFERENPLAKNIKVTQLIPKRNQRAPLYLKFSFTKSK